MFIVLYHVFCYDLWYYISHVILHNPQIYFIHKIHHSTKYNDLTWRATNVAHIIEAPVQSLGIFVPFITSNTSYLILFYAWLFIMFRSYLRHEHRAAWLVGNHHLLHHRYPKYNFGEYWLDYLCGTKYPNENEYIYGMIYS